MYIVLECVALYVLTGRAGIIRVISAAHYKDVLQEMVKIQHLSQLNWKKKEKKTSCPWIQPLKAMSKYKKTLIVCNKTILDNVLGNRYDHY